MKAREHEHCRCDRCDVGLDRELYDAAGDGDEALVSQCIEQGAKVDWRGGIQLYTRQSGVATPLWSDVS